MNKNFLALIILIVVLIIVIIAAASYESRPEIDPPAGFIEIENQSYDYEYEAWSPKNIKIGINTHENESEASLDFWVEHIKNVFVKTKNYEFIEAKDFSSTIGKGKCLVFEHMIAKVKYVYLAGITCTASDVYVIEAAGEKEIIDPEIKNILKSFATLN